MPATTTAAAPTEDAIRQALAGVNDPEIRRPITDLGMVSDVRVEPDGRVRVEVCC